MLESLCDLAISIVTSPFRFFGSVMQPSAHCVKKKAEENAEDIGYALGKGYAKGVGDNIPGDEWKKEKENDEKPKSRDRHDRGGTRDNGVDPNRDRWN